LDRRPSQLSSVRPFSLGKVMLISGVGRRQELVSQVDSATALEVLHLPIEMDCDDDLVQSVKCVVSSRDRDSNINALLHSSLNKSSSTPSANVRNTRGRFTPPINVGVGRGRGGPGRGRTPYARPQSRSTSRPSHVEGRQQTTVPSRGSRRGRRGGR